MGGFSFYELRDGPLEAVRYELLRAGYTAPRLDAGQMRTWSAFYAELAAACQFPTYFGHNYAAAADLLTDFEWAPSVQGYVLCFSRAELVLIDEPEQELQFVVSLVDESAAYWLDAPPVKDIWGRPIPPATFAAVLHTDGSADSSRWLAQGAAVGPIESLTECPT